MPDHIADAILARTYLVLSYTLRSLVPVGPKGDAMTKGSDEKPHRIRRDGWTALRRRAFLRALGETGSVRDACARVQVSRVSAYALKRRCEAFATAWERALAERHAQ